MPKKLANWTFKDVERFLRQEGFILNYSNGSHYYYRGSCKGSIKNVCVPFHGTNVAIKPRTLKGIILQSGIPLKEWTE